jgi:hypothetical protein
MQYLRSKNRLGNPSRARNLIASAATNKLFAASHTSITLLLALSSD